MYLKVFISPFLWAFALFVVGPILHIESFSLSVVNPTFNIVFSIL